MLQRHDSETVELIEHGYLIAVEAETPISTEFIANKLAESLVWVEGIGNIDVHYMGPITEAPEGENG